MSNQRSGRRSAASLPLKMTHHLELIVFLCTFALIISRSSSHKRLHRGAFAADGRTMRTDRVTSDRRWNDEGLGVMNRERFKFSAGTFDHGFFALDEIQHVDA